DRITGGGATLEVVLQGVTNVPDSGGHRVAIRVNGMVVGTLAFDGRDHVTKSFSVSGSVLTEGDNIITLASMNGESDVSLVDVLRLPYQRLLVANDDSLRFSASGGRAVTLTGFSSADIHVYDISDPSAVVEVIGRTTASGAGYRVSLVVPGSGLRQLIAVT